MTTKKKVDVREKMRALKAEFASNNVDMPLGESMAAMIGDEWNLGNKVICRKAFIWDSARYAIGDEFIPEDKHRGRALKLAKFGYFIPAVMYSAGKKRADLQDVLNKSERHATRVNQYDTQVVKAEGALVAARAEVTRWENEIRTLKSQRSQAESILSQALDGFEPD